MTGSENNIVVGLQWGNEGKGRVIEFLTHKADVIVRFQGCSNGGRTITTGGERYRVNFLPSGIHHDGKQCLICGGVVVDPEKLSGEIDLLKDAGVLKAQLTVSRSCPVLLDYHKKIDVLERRLAWDKNRSSAFEQGLSAACSDACGRARLTLGDLTNQKSVEGRVAEVLSLKNEQLVKTYGEKGLDEKQLLSKYAEIGEKLAPYAGDPVSIVENAYRKNLGILFEGCGGTMCDVDRGTHPYASPVSTTAAAAVRGTGLRWNAGPRVIGVAKAYTTRADSGPFITEMNSHLAAFVRSRGNEVSEQAGENRRVGWLDIPALRYAVRENGVHLLAMTKLDVLTGIDELRICTAYMLDGVRHEIFDLTADEMERAEPVYEILPGWHGELSLCSGFLSLPSQTQDYIAFVEEATGTDIIWGGVGKEWGSALFKTGV